MYHEMKLTGLLAVPRDYRVCEHVTSERGMRASPFFDWFTLSSPTKFQLTDSKGTPRSQVLTR